MKSNIKYDLITLKRLLIAAIAMSIPVLLSLVLIFRGHAGIEFLRKNEGIVTLGISLFWPMVLLWIIYLDGRIYLNNLQKAGYEIPYNKKDYDGKVANLPRVFEVEINNDGQCKDSLRLSTIAGIATGGLFIAWLKYLWQWYIVEDIEVMLIYMSALTMLWGIGAYVYYRQADNTKFRNLNEPDDGRKVRSTLGSGIFTIVLCGFISVFLVSLSFSITKYIAKSRIVNDRDNILLFTHMLNQVCKEHDLSQDDPLYEQLRQGMDPFNTKWADEEILNETLEQMGLNYIDQLEDKLYMKGGEVCLKLVDDHVEASYTYLWEYGKPETENYY